MIILTEKELEQVGGGKLLKFVFPVVIGFIIGGPAGAIYAAGTIIATTGVSNLEHLYGHNEIPTINNIVNE